MDGTGLPVGVVLQHGHAVPHRKRIDGPALGKAHGLARGVLEIGDAVEKARLFRRGKHGLQRGRVYAVVLHRHAGQARAAAAERVERPQERRVFHSHHVALVAKAFGREIQDLLAAGCNEHAVVFLRHPFAPVGKGPHGFAHRGHALRHRILQRGHRVLPQQFVRKARDVLRRE